VGSLEEFARGNPQKKTAKRARVSLRFISKFTLAPFFCSGPFFFGNSFFATATVARRAAGQFFCQKKKDGAIKPQAMAP
jgi:hypothetical protein